MLSDYFNYIVMGIIKERGNLNNIYDYELKHMCIRNIRIVEGLIHRDVLIEFKYKSIDYIYSGKDKKVVRRGLL